MLNAVEVRDTSKSIASISGNQPHAELVTKKQVAKAIGISVRTVEGMMARKVIPFFKLSPRLVRFSLGRVKAALNRYEVLEIGGASK